MLVVMWNRNSRNMMERNFINISFLFLTILLSAISQCSSALSNERLCYNADCSELVSLAKTTVRYVPNEPGLLSFDVNVEVKVYSKEAGNRTDLWGVEINGKRGYAPKVFLKEYRVLRKNLTHKVSTNPLDTRNALFNKESKPKEENEKSMINTNNIEASSDPISNSDSVSTAELPYKDVDGTKPFQVIDGTTFHLDQDVPSVQPAVVVETIEQTVVPNKQGAIDTESRSDNEKSESNTFTGSDNVSKADLIDEVVNENESISSNVDVNDLMQSSEDVLDLPELPGISISPLNKSAISDQAEHEVVIKDDVPSGAKSNQPLEPLTGNVSQTVMPEENKPALHTHSGVVVAIDKQSDTILSKKVVTNSTNSNVDVAKDLDKIETNETQPSEGIPVVSVNDVKIDLQLEETTNKIEEKDVQPSESSTVIEHNDTKAEVKVAHDSVKSEKEEAPALEGQTFPAVHNTKPDDEVKNVESNESEMGDANNAVPGIQSDEPSDESKRNTQSLGEKATVIVSDTKADVQATENIDGTMKTEASDTTLHVQGAEPVLEDTKSLENTSIGASIDTKPEADSAEAADEFSAQYTPPLNSIAPDTKQPVPTENVRQLDIQQVESVQENESTEDLSAHNKADYMPPLFMQFQAKNQMPKTVASDNVEAASESMENISGLDTKDVKSDSDADNIASATETPGTSINVDVVADMPVAEVVLDAQPNLQIEDTISVKEAKSQGIIHEVQVSSPGVCMLEDANCSPDNIDTDFLHHEEPSQANENAIMEGIHVDGNYWMTLMYLSVTAIATLIFSLGYYCIENMRRDRELIARINKLEKDLLISEAECSMVNENLKSTKEKLNRMEDESFGSDEMVLSLRADLEASQKAKAELEDQVAMLEKDLESATEAGLELEKMLREVLSSNNEVNPLAQSVEDLQTRLNAQQAANESLTNALNLKAQENESLSAELVSVKKKYEELEVELTRATDSLRLEVNNRNSIEQVLNDKVQKLEMQLKEISTEKETLQKELKGKEVEAKDLVEVINKLNSNNLDFDKLYDVSHVKAEATALLEERNELKVRLAEIEGAHNLLEEHVKVVKEEMAALTEQCKVAEKEKKDAETRLEVLTNFFEEKDAQRQKEEAIWLQQQGEVVSTVERIQTMQNEIQNYKQQIEMLRREILDQEREYKSQISILETKAHEQWVIARQVERRLEESKVEAGQLRNRLTLIEKNINDVDSEAKLHRLEANGETTTSPPLFLGAEPSGSPIMFSASTNVPPPPPPSYLHSLFPPYLPPPLPNTSAVPPYEVSQRPPPLGGRLSSPPPIPPMHPPASNRYDNVSSPPPMSPHLLPPFNHRSPPLPPFGNDMHPPPPPPPGSILPPSLGAPHSWGEESLPPPRNSGFHPPVQRERVRNHKGSLHSSGESLDKSHHNKV